MAIRWAAVFATVLLGLVAFEQPCVACRYEMFAWQPEERAAAEAAVRARTDPNAAIRLATRIKEPGLRALARGAIASAIIQSKPARAEELMRRAIDDAGLTTHYIGDLPTPLVPLIELIPSFPPEVAGDLVDLAWVALLKDVGRGSDASALLARLTIRYRPETVLPRLHMSLCHVGQRNHLHPAFHVFGTHLAQAEPMEVEAFLGRKVTRKPDPYACDDILEGVVSARALVDFDAVLPVVWGGREDPQILLYDIAETARFAGRADVALRAIETLEAGFEGGRIKPRYSSGAWPARLRTALMRDGDGADVLTFTVGGRPWSLVRRREPEHERPRTWTHRLDWTIFPSRTEARRFLDEAEPSVSAMVERNPCDFSQPADLLPSRRFVAGLAAALGDAARAGRMLATLPSAPERDAMRMRLEWNRTFTWPVRDWTIFGVPLLPSFKFADESP